MKIIDVLLSLYSQLLQVNIFLLVWADLLRIILNIFTLYFQVRQELVLNN